jgi:hypothetical protein
MTFRSLSQIGCALCVAALAVSTVGCGSKSDSKPNPEFTVPDIPSGKRDMPAAGGKKTTEK